MIPNVNNVAPNSGKSQWTSPEVWDLAVGRTQGGNVFNPTEGLPVSIGDDVVDSTSLLGPSQRTKILEGNCGSHPYFLKQEVTP